MDTYKKWVPVQGIEKELWVQEVHDDKDGLRIRLNEDSATTKILCVAFEHYFLFRNIDESGRIRLWATSFFEDRKWQFCVATSSKLIEWLHEESDGIYDKKDMIHYLIKTGTDVIDVITNQIPEVNWINNSQTPPPKAVA